MWGELFKALLGSVTPQLKPVLDLLVRKAVEAFLKNLGGNSTGGVMSLSTGVTPEQVDAAVAKAVEDLMAS